MRVLTLILVLLGSIGVPQAAAVICQDPPACFVPPLTDGSLVVDVCDKVTNPAFPLVGQETQRARPACPILEGLPWPGNPLTPPEGGDDAICDHYPFLIHPADDIGCHQTLSQGYVSVAILRTDPPCEVRICDHHMLFQLDAEGKTPGTWRIETTAFLVKHLYENSWNVGVPGSLRSMTCSFTPIEDDGCAVDGAPGTFQTDSNAVASLYGVWDTKTWWSPAPGVDELVSQGRGCRVLWGLGNVCVGI